MTDRKVNLFFVAFAVLNLLSVNIAHAFYPLDLERLKASNNCPNCYLNNISWPNANLAQVDLSSAELYGANLSSANLFRANLSNANLYGINMSNAGLYNANLSSAGAQVAVFTNANLNSANLSNAALTGANLSSANLNNANLSNSDLVGANLASADLYGANLSNANVKRANLSGANLNGATLSGAIFDHAIWIDGDKCREGSIGMCKKYADLKLEQEPPAAAAAPVAARLDDNYDIYFEVDDYSLDQAAERTLDRLAEWLKAHPEYIVLIEGHCDERPTRQTNQVLGANRAKSAMNYLVNKGIDSARITTVSFAAERPVDSRHNESAWAKNRRAHFILSIKK
jgi:peptidoglycan-associated lipoprotein